MIYDDEYVSPVIICHPYIIINEIIIQIDSLIFKFWLFSYY